MVFLDSSVSLCHDFQALCKRCQFDRKLTVQPRIWNALAVVGIALTYWPHSQLRKERKSAREVLPLIDYVGAFLSTGGLTML